MSISWNNWILHKICHNMTTNYTVGWIMILSVVYIGAWLNRTSLDKIAIVYAIMFSKLCIDIFHVYIPGHSYANWYTSYWSVTSLYCLFSQQISGGTWMAINIWMVSSYWNVSILVSAQVRPWCSFHHVQENLIKYSIVTHPRISSLRHKVVLHYMFYS